jgi:hypothetical protein
METLLPVQKYFWAAVPKNFDWALYGEEKDESGERGAIVLPSGLEVGRRDT